MKEFFSLSCVKPLFCLLLSVIIVGCASLEERKRIAECRASSSYNDGLSDAMNGLKSRFQFYNNRCEQYGVSLNENLYIKGYKKGIKKFCTYKSAYQFGLKAGKYKNTCTANKEVFLKGYRAADKKCLYEEGYSDAIKGEIESFTRSACLKLSPKLSQAQYKEGWRAGLKVFCTYKSGYQFGRQGNSYNNTCPKKNRR